MSYKTTSLIVSGIVTVEGKYSTTCGKWEKGITTLIVEEMN